MSLARYPRYRNTGVEWLHEVPEHWQNQTLNARFSIELGKMLDESRITGRHLLPYLRNVDVQWGTINFEDLPQMDIMDAERLRYTIREGDLLVCEGGESGRAAIVADTPGVIGFQKALHRLRPRDDSEEPKFMYYTLAWASATGVFSVGGSSTIAHLTGEQLRRYRFPKPPLEEQRTISAFLDRETTKLDTLIAEQQRLIELLKEKRQAIISHAVTKGLNAAAPMKNSGIEWLGSVPLQWDILPTKRLFKMVADPAPTNNDLELLSIYTEIGVRPRKDLEAKGNKATTTDGYWKVQKGDLIVNKLLAWMGAIGISNYDGVTSPAYDVLRPVRQLEPQFFDYLFRCGICFSEFRRYSRGIMDMRLRLYFEQFGQLPMPVPPLALQKEIVTYLGTETKRIDILSSEAEIAIDLLRERRTALISAVVTGKLDARHLATTACEKEAAA